MSTASYNFSKNMEKILSSIRAIQDGVCKRADVNEDLKVYECKNIIRIDIRNDG